MKSNKDILFTENPNRFVLFPIQHNNIWELYKKQVSMFWIPEEIDFTDDIKHWNTRLSN